MSAICQYCGIAMGQVKRFEMEMARRFPEQENVGGCRYFGGWPVAKAGTQGRAANATKRGARETKAHGGLRVFPCPIGTKERALTWGTRLSTITRTVENPTLPSANLPCVLRLTYLSDANHSYMEKPLRK